MKPINLFTSAFIAFSIIACEKNDDEVGAEDELVNTSWRATLTDENPRINQYMLVPV